MTAILIALVLSLSDGQNTRPACTSYTFDSATAKLVMSPTGCLGAIPVPVPADSPTMFEPLVRATYLSEMGREVDPGGLSFWSGWLFDRRTAPGIEQTFVDIIHGSDEAIAYRASKQPPAPVSGGVTSAQLFSPTNICDARSWPSPGPCGAVPVPVGDCSSGMPGAITQAWQLNLLGDISTFYFHSLHLTMAKGQAISFMFHTGAKPAVAHVGGFGQSSSSIGMEAATFMSVSQTRCDFSQALVNTANPCYRSAGGTDNAVPTRFSPTGTPADSQYCELLPNTTYFLNLRFENANGANRGKEACPAARCAAALDIR